MFFVAQAYPRQQPARILFGLFARSAQHTDRRDHQVLQDTEVGEQIELLEHEADAFAQLVEFGFMVQRVHWHTAHFDFAA